MITRHGTAKALLMKFEPRACVWLVQCTAVNSAHFDVTVYIQTSITKIVCNVAVRQVYTITFFSISWE